MNVKIEAIFTKNSIIAAGREKDYSKMFCFIHRYQNLISKKKIERNYTTTIANHLLNAARTVENEGNLKLAERMCRKAILLDPSSNVAVTNLGLMLFKQDRYEEALQLFKKKMPENGFYYSTSNKNMGTILYFIERYEEALEKFDNALRADATYQVAYINKSMTLFHLQRHTEAQEAFDKYIETAGDVLSVDQAMSNFEGEVQGYEKLLESETDQIKRKRFEKVIEGGKGLLKKFENYKTTMLKIK